MFHYIFDCTKYRIARHSRSAFGPARNSPWITSYFDSLHFKATDICLLDASVSPGTTNMELCSSFIRLLAL
jgi:hypothetical protein